MTSTDAVELLIFGALLLIALFTTLGALLIVATFALRVGGERVQEQLFATKPRLRSLAQRLRLDSPQSFFGTGERVPPLVWLGALVILPAIVISPVVTMSDRGAALALVAFCLAIQSKLLSLYLKRPVSAFVPEDTAK